MDDPDHTGHRAPQPQASGLALATAVVLVTAVVAAVLGPRPAYLLHRILPLEHGPAALVGLHYDADEEEVGLPLGHTDECVESSRRRRCDYVVRLHLPGGGFHLATPMLWLEGTRGGPDVMRVDVVAAAGVPPRMAPARLASGRWCVHEQRRQPRRREVRAPLTPRRQGRSAAEAVEGCTRAALADR